MTSSIITQRQVVAECSTERGRETKGNPHQLSYRQATPMAVVEGERRSVKSSKVLAKGKRSREELANWFFSPLSSSLDKVSASGEDDMVKFWQEGEPNICHVLRDLKTPPQLPVGWAFINTQCLISSLFRHNRATAHWGVYQLNTDEHVDAWRKTGTKGNYRPKSDTGVEHGRPHLKSVHSARPPDP